MSEAVLAKNIVYLFRTEGEVGHAWLLGRQTDGSTDESRSFETTETKDGPIKTEGAYEATHSITAVMVHDDPRIRELRQLTRKPRKLEVWEIDRTNISDSTTIYGEYSVDSVTSVSISAGAEGTVEVTIETEVNGTIVSGPVDVTPELVNILRTDEEEQDFVDVAGGEEQDFVDVAGGEVEG